EMVKTKLTIVAVNFGPQELKNICQKVEVFKVLIKPLGHAAIEIAPSRHEKLQVSETQVFEPYLVGESTNGALAHPPALNGQPKNFRHFFKPITSRPNLRRALPLVTLGILLPALFFQPGTSQRGLSSASLASIQQIVPDTLQRRTNSTEASAQTSLLVTYFDNRTADERDAWLAAGLTDMLITDMQGVNGLQVLGRAELEDAMQTAGGKPAGMNLQFARAVAQHTASDLMLCGSIVRDGNTLRFDVQVFETHSGELLLAEKVSGESVLQMVTDLSNQLKMKLEPLMMNRAMLAQK
ncbi:hypothetical protein DWB58_29000, partial [candidate division KSB1 bacterium]|nr:hypothetical protein [candidate division KSB1 bacterium]